MSFSKEWVSKLESCSHAIASYETPAPGGDMKMFKPSSEEYEDTNTINIKDRLNKLYKRRGESKVVKGRPITMKELRYLAKYHNLDKYLDEEK